MASPEPVKPRVWVIDVCKTCGRHAIWPFCEHRPEGYVPDGTPSWCEPVRVRELGRRREGSNRS